MLSESAAIFAQETFFLFGGWTDLGPTDVIAKLDATTFQWSMVGRLNAVRYYHGAIAVDDVIFIIGGYGEKQTERCTIFNNEVKCVNQEPRLSFYAAWPELVLVGADFCT